eukprot:6478924-Amphidinium_carterae.1
MALHWMANYSMYLKDVGWQPYKLNRRENWSKHGMGCGSCHQHNTQNNMVEMRRPNMCPFYNCLVGLHRVGEHAVESAECRDHCTRSAFMPQTEDAFNPSKLPGQFSMEQERACVPASNKNTLCVVVGSTTKMKLYACSAIFKMRCAVLELADPNAGEPIGMLWTQQTSTTLDRIMRERH